MRCWNCGAEVDPEELDTDPIPMPDLLAGIKIYDCCCCPHCGVVIVYLKEEELY